MISHVHEVAKGTQSDENIMILMGDDFTHGNAYATMKETQKIIDLCNKNNQYNLTFQWSTPGEYIDALKQESIKWPVFQGELLNYYQEKWAFWVGYYSSRPTQKKHIRDASAKLHAISNLYAKMMVD